MSDIILMVGIQGSGKSTWANNFVEEHDKVICISRDTIRKELIGDGEYFSKEDEVWETFCNSMVEAVQAQGEWNYIIIDATHISIGSRRKVLNEITKRTDTSKYNLKITVMDTPLLTCLHRNDERTGFEFVPKSVIKRFSEQFDMPTLEEFDIFKNKFNDIDIIHVKEGNN